MCCGGIADGQVYSCEIGAGDFLYFYVRGELVAVYRGTGRMIRDGLRHIVRGRMRYEAIYVDPNDQLLLQGLELELEIA